MSRTRTVAVGLVVAALAACGSGEGSGSRAGAGADVSMPVEASESSSSTAPEPEGHVVPPSSGGGEGTAAGPAPAPPAAPSHPGAPSTAEEPGRYVPAPGEYVYDVTGYVETTGIGGGREPVPPVSVDTVTVRGPAERQEMTIATRNGDEATSQELAVVVSRDDARLTRLTYRSDGGGMAYDVRPEPPAVLARFPYVAGDAWEIAWRDPATGIAGTGSGAVTGPETVTTPLGVHETMVVTVRQRLRGTVDGRLSVTTWLDPRTGTTVKQHTVTDFDDPTGASHAESTRVLRQQPT